ncbi:MAG: hypothetical protein KDK36_18360, partial [Leptospiraceae bacterium]|nr:hypothetical protein [Leptospiraceae bacterium]
MKLVYIIIIFLISFCSTQTKEELKDSKVVKKAQKVNQNLPLGLRPCKEYLNEDADPFRITFEKLGVPYQEPKLNSKRELEVKFKYKLFDVHLLKDSSGFFENYKYKNKEFFFSFYETSEYYYCSLTNYYEENPKQYFSLEYSIHKAFRYEKFKNAIQIICQGKESDWIKERITYKSP